MEDFRKTKEYQDFIKKIYGYKPYIIKLEEKRYKRKNNLCLMADYCAEPFWLNTLNIEFESNKIPNNLKIFRRRFNNWVEKYESMFILRETTKFENKVFNNTNKYKNWLKEGYQLAKLLRKLSPSRFNIQYFDESKIKRITLNKRKVK